MGVYCATDTDVAGDRLAQADAAEPRTQTKVTHQHSASPERDAQEPQVQQELGIQLLLCEAMSDTSARVRSCFPLWHPFLACSTAASSANMSPCADRQRLHSAQSKTPDVESDLRSPLAACCAMQM